jgi:hypothetical protein
MNLWVPEMKQQAIQWLAVKELEARERADASSDAQAEAARVTNELASEANAIAREASAAAIRSANAAHISNRIAAAALIAAMIAIVVSIIGLVHTVGHADAPKAQAAAKAH